PRPIPPRTRFADPPVQISPELPHLLAPIRRPPAGNEGLHLQTALDHPEQQRSHQPLPLPRRTHPPSHPLHPYRHKTQPPHLLALTCARHPCLPYRVAGIPACRIVLQASLPAVSCCRHPCLPLSCGRHPYLPYR